MARQYLAIIISSALIKRAFSIASNILGKTKQALSTNKAKKIILLKSWKIKSIEEINLIIQQYNNIYKEKKNSHILIANNNKLLLNLSDFKKKDIINSTKKKNGISD